MSKKIIKINQKGGTVKEQLDCRNNIENHKINVNNLSNNIINQYLIEKKNQPNLDFNIFRTTLVNKIKNDSGAEVNNKLLDFIEQITMTRYLYGNSKDGKDKTDSYKKYNELFANFCSVYTDYDMSKLNGQIK